MSHDGPVVPRGKARGGTGLGTGSFTHVPDGGRPISCRRSARSHRGGALFQLPRGPPLRGAPGRQNLGHEAQLPSNDYSSPADSVTRATPGAARVAHQPLGGDLYLDVDASGQIQPLE
jgi:hypothetical protein